MRPPLLDVQREAGEARPRHARHVEGVAGRFAPAARTPRMPRARRWSVQRRRGTRRSRVERHPEARERLALGAWKAVKAGCTRSHTAGAPASSRHSRNLLVPVDDRREGPDLRDVRATRRCPHSATKSETSISTVTRTCTATRAGSARTAAVAATCRDRWGCGAPSLHDRGRATSESEAVERWPCRIEPTTSTVECGPWHP